MDLIVILTGMLPVVLLVSAALGGIASLLLLRLYRRAVVRAMSAGSDSGAPVPAPEAPRGPSSDGRALVVRAAEADYPISAQAQARYDATSVSLRRLGAVYAIAGLAYAIVLSLPWMITAGDGFPLTRFLWLFACYAWPTVLTLMLVATTTVRGRFIVAGGYFGLVSLIGLIALLRNPVLGAGELIFFWFFANGGATLLLDAALTRRIRAVGPLVLAFMVVGVTGAFVAVSVADSSDTLLRAIVAAGGALGLGATSLFVLLHVIGFALFAALGWWLLGILGRAYRNKRMSDQSLTVDALWLLFGVLQPITLAFEGWGWIFTGLFGFAVYKTITILGFARLTERDHADDEQRPALLLLRVFALGRRSERLFDALSKHWLRAGSIGLIAGPDLVTSTVEPHEFLDFVGGRLSRQFIEGEAELERRLAERDTRPDPDGRYRVNELFCRRDTWQMAMRRLAATSQVVLMDLRSFSPRNQGCLYELEQLLGGVPLEQVLLVADDTTDLPFLERKLQELWRDVPADSPNRGPRAPEVRLFRAHSASPAQAAEGLVKTLFDACTPAV